MLCHWNDNMMCQWYDVPSGWMFNCQSLIRLYACRTEYKRCFPECSPATPPLLNCRWNRTSCRYSSRRQCNGLLPILRSGYWLRIDRRLGVRRREYCVRVRVLEEWEFPAVRLVERMRRWGLGRWGKEPYLALLGSEREFHSSPYDMSLCSWNAWGEG